MVGFRLTGKISKVSLSAREFRPLDSQKCRVGPRTSCVVDGSDGIRAVPLQASKKEGEGKGKRRREEERNARGERERAREERSSGACTNKCVVSFVLCLPEVE